MEDAKKHWALMKDVYHNRRDHGDIFSLKLLPPMDMCCLFWTTERYLTIHWWKKALQAILLIHHFVAFGGGLLYSILITIDESLTKAMYDFAFCAIATAAIFCAVCVQFASPCFTEVIKIITKKNREVLDRDYNKEYNRNFSNKIYLFSNCFLWGCNVCVFIACCPYGYIYFQTGNVYFQNYFFQLEPFSVASAVSQIAQITNMIWMALMVSVVNNMYTELMLRIVFILKATANEMRHLWSEEEPNVDRECRKFGYLVRDFNLMRWCVSEFNTALKAYMLTYIFLLLATLGLFIGLALSVEHLSDLVEIVFFPLYLLMFVTAFCILGQFLSDSADESGEAIYECEWYNAPHRFQTLVLNFMTQSMLTTKMEAQPLFDIDFILLLRIAKNTYTIIAVARNAIMQ